jgi:hypothetical protein
VAEGRLLGNLSAVDLDRNIYFANLLLENKIFG